MHAMVLFPSFLPFDALQIHYIGPIKHSVDTEKQLGMTLLQALFLPTPPPSTFMSVLKAYSAAGNRTSPGGVLRISSDREDRMGANIETTQNPWAFKQKNSWTKLYPPPPRKKKSYAKFPNHKNFRRNYAAGMRGNYYESSYCLNTPKYPTKIKLP